MSLLSLDGLTASLRGRTVLRDVSFSIDHGECIGLLGPNGAGKSSLMRAALGLLPHDGTSSLSQMLPAARARAAAWMPQAREIAWPVSVETLVMLGRIPHLSAGQRPSDTDRAVVEAAMVSMDIAPFRNRSATELSGGEQTRVLIARTLAQETPLIIADEPVAGLDPAHQIATLQTFAGLAREGRSVLVSLHDLGLAARHCSRLILLSDGRIVADGPPVEVLTPERVAEIFGIRAFYRETEDGPVFQPLEVVP